MLQIKLLRLDSTDVFDDGCFCEIQVRLRSVGGFVFERSKYGSSCFKRQKVWELSLEMTQSVGALALRAQKYGSSRFIRPQVWALPF